MSERSTVSPSGGTTRRPETMLVLGEDWLRTQFGAAELARLAAAATLADPIAATELSSPPVRARLAVVEVLITSWGCPPLDRDVLGHVPRLRAVLHAAGSVRGHVGQAVFDRGILVTTAADANAQPVARYTLAAILWAAKRVPFLAADARVHRDDWSYRHEHGELGGSLTVVLVGFSRVGRRVARLLQLVGVTGVLVVDPFADPAAVAATGAELVTLEEALPRAGVLSLHAPHLPATRHMIGDAELAALPPGATLVNTARGGLVDHAALERACLAGLHAILDVTEPEPLPPASVLYELPNVMVTPHVAGSLGAETRLLAASALTELERYAAGLPPLDAVTAQSLELQALGGVIVVPTRTQPGPRGLAAVAVYRMDAGPLGGDGRPAAARRAAARGPRQRAHWPAGTGQSRRGVERRPRGLRPHLPARGLPAGGRGRPRSPRPGRLVRGRPRDGHRPGRAAAVAAA